MMQWVNFSVLLLLAIAPYPMAYFTCSRQIRRLEPDQREHARAGIRPGLRLLAIINGLAVAAIALWVAIEWNMSTSQQLTRHATPIFLACFHGQWWLFAAPVLRKLDRLLNDYDSAPGRYRVASLVPRTLSSYLPTWWLWAVVATLGALPAVTMARIFQEPIAESRLIFGAIFMTLTGVFVLVGFRFVCRSLLSNRSLGFRGIDQTEETLQTIELERRERINLLFAIDLTMANSFMVGGLLFAEVGRGTIQETTAGIIGGVLGTLVGIGGGAVGTWYGIRSNARRVSLRNRAATATPQNQRQ